MTTTHRIPDILVIDDEPELRQTIRSILEGAGYGVREAASGRIALGEITLRAPDAILLDLGLPDINGRQVLQALRSICSAPVLVISVFTEESSKVSALDAGADDYITKPFGGRELLARLRALQRRAGLPLSPQVLRFGPILVDLTKRKVSRGGKRIKLTRTEYALLELLITHRDQVLTHKEILREVWGAHAEAQIHYLRLYMTRLRHKLGEDIASTCFETESGIGYRFVSDPDSGD